MAEAQQFSEIRVTDFLPEIVRRYPTGKYREIFDDPENILPHADHWGFREYSRTGDLLEAHIFRFTKDTFFSQDCSLGTDREYRLYCLRAGYWLDSGRLILHPLPLQIRGGVYRLSGEEIIDYLQNFFTETSLVSVRKNGDIHGQDGLFYPGAAAYRRGFCLVLYCANPYANDPLQTCYYCNQIIPKRETDKPHFSGVYTAEESQQSWEAANRLEPTVFPGGTIENGFLRLES